MSSTSRSRKASSPSDVDAASLSNVERLLVSQAVFEYGSEAWQNVSKVLSKHPMISRPKGFFSPQVCYAIFLQLIQEAGLGSPEVTAFLPHAKTLRALAHRHYSVRLLELKELINAEDVKFKSLVSEIDEVRDGGQENGKALTTEDEVEEEAMTSKEQVEAPIDVVEDEVCIGGSESAGVVAEDEASTTTRSLIATVQVELNISSGSSQAPGSPIRDFSPPLAPSPTQAAPETGAPEHIPMPHDEAVESVMDVSVESVEEKEAVSEVGQKEPLDEKITDEAQSSLFDESSHSEPHLPENMETLDMELASSPAPEALLKLPGGRSPAHEASAELSHVETGTVAPSVPEGEASRAEVTKGKRKASDVGVVSSESQREKKRAREDSEGAEDEDTGPSTRVRRRERQVTAENHIVSKRFQNVIGMLHSQISQHRYGNIFHNPIKKSEAPDYHDIVKRPMDLKTIKARIKDGLISNSLEFQRDVYLMFANAIMYNRPGSEIVNMAEEMMSASEVHINTFRQTEGFHRV